MNAIHGFSMRAKARVALILAIAISLSLLWFGLGIEQDKGDESGAAPSEFEETRFKTIKDLDSREVSPEMARSLVVTVSGLRIGNEQDNRVTVRGPDGSEVEEAPSLSATESKDGENVYTYLAPIDGMYTAMLTRVGGELVDSKSVAVTGASASVRLYAPAPMPEPWLVIWAYGPDGEHLRHVTATPNFESEDPNGIDGKRCYVRSDGATVMYHYDKVLPLNSIPDPNDKRWIAEVSVEGFGFQRIFYNPLYTNEIRVDFAVPATPTIVVQEYSGSEYVDRLGLAIEVVGTDVYWYSRVKGFDYRPDENGRFKLGPMQPGALRVWMTVSESPSPKGYWAFRGDHLVSYSEVMIESGQRELSLPIPALYTLQVSVPDARPGTRVRLVYPPELRRKPPQLPIGAELPVVQTGQADDLHKVVFEYLPAGTYVLGFSYTEGGREVRVTVPEESTVILTGTGNFGR